MNKTANLIILSLITTVSTAQSIFLRHDTTLLLASECNWLMTPVPVKGKSANAIPIAVADHETTVSEWFLSSINKGRLKAFDPFSGDPIPSKRIYNWNMPADTIAVFDEKDEISKYKVVNYEVKPEKINRIRVQKDWWLDKSTGKIFTRTRWIELLIEVQNSSGTYIAHKPFCRIYY